MDYQYIEVVFRLLYTPYNRLLTVGSALDYPKYLLNAVSPYNLFFAVIDITLGDRYDY